jgi:hypothetical protein
MNESAMVIPMPAVNLYDDEKCRAAAIEYRSNVFKYVNNFAKALGDKDFYHGAIPADLSAPDLAVRDALLPSHLPFTGASSRTTNTPALQHQWWPVPASRQGTHRQSGMHVAGAVYSVSNLDMNSW